MISAAMLEILLVGGLLLMFMGGLADIDACSDAPIATSNCPVRRTIRRTVRRFAQRRTCDGHSTDRSSDTDTKSDGLSNCPTSVGQCRAVPPCEHY